jgi:6-pyruvoyltetrahydropterin/6-carboxytetrahydropterin synthase
MPTYEVILHDEFAAAHQLRMYDGNPERLHGHNWRVTVILAGDRLDEIGVLVDFTPIRARLRAELAAMHDTFLNDLPAFANRNPSAEIVATHLFERLSADLPSGVRVARVQVSEAPGCQAACIADA